MPEQLSDDEYAEVPEGMECAACSHDVDRHAMFGDHFCCEDDCGCDCFEMPS
jgi:hypothetical protein